MLKSSLYVSFKYRRIPTTNVNSVSVSTNTRPSSMAARTPPAAPGLRAMPSHAAAAMRPCPSPPPTAAMATPKPAANASVLGLRGAFSPAAPPCANAAGAIIITATSISKTTAAFFIDFLLVNCRQEVVPGHRAAGLTLKRLLQAQLVFVRGRNSDISGGQDREHIGLNHGNK